MSKVNWKFDESRIKEVKHFKYLGFYFQNNGKFTKHLEAMAATGKRRVAEVYGID